jgi:hypothetical protein
MLCSTALSIEDSDSICSPGESISICSPDESSSGDDTSEERDNMCVVTKAIFEGLSDYRKPFYISTTGRCRLCGNSMKSHQSLKEAAKDSTGTSSGTQWRDDELLILQVFLRQTKTVTEIDHILLRQVWHDQKLPVRSREAFHKKVLQIRSKNADIEPNTVSKIMLQLST